MKDRRWFNILAIATLIGFVIFCGIVTWAAAAAPRFRKSPLDGYRLESQSYTQPRFEENDTRVGFVMMKTYRRSEIDRKTIDERISTPTGRTGAGPVARSVMASAAAIKQLMNVGAFDVAYGENCAISTDHRELAFVTRAPRIGVVLRAESGEYRSLAGTPLPDWAEQLNTTRSGTAAERLSNPALPIWVDAAMESFLKEGPRPTIVADRLLRGGDGAVQTAQLVALLLSLDGSVTLDEVVRVAVGEPALASRLLEGATQQAGRYVQRRDGTLVPAAASRAAVLEALVRRDWGDKPSLAIIDWAIGFLEVGGLETVSIDVRKAVLVRLKSVVGSSQQLRLEKVLTERTGADAAAAYLLLRRIVGEPLEGDPDPQLVEEGRAWLAARRKDK